jgi:hypothetical protein
MRKLLHLVVRVNPMRQKLVMLAAGGLLAAAGCGGGDGGETPTEDGGQASGFERRLEVAQSPTEGDFPSAQGKTLQEIANGVSAVEAGPATSEFIPGENRLAFGVIGKDNKFIYGQSAAYVARTPNDPARGPYLAPADPLVVDPPFRSQGAALETDAIAAIYEAQVPLGRPGPYAVLVVTKTPQGLVGGALNVRVKPDSPIPAVGERAPRVDTDTIASAGGDVKAIETREPADEMHEENLADVLGKKPVVLLMSTPALCQTRVCGPVTDIAAQLQKDYGDQAAFIHQEVYVDNDVQKGLRKPLREFGLRTEPWLFTFTSDGRVAARLEGSFGNRAFERAVEAALES